MMKSRRWMVRMMSILLIVIAAGTVLMLAAGAAAKLRLARLNPAPGRLVNVNGSRMHLYCTGEGSPTVVLDAGINDFSVFWAAVQPEVARQTRVCSYDRLGLGWSERGARPRTNDRMVEELHTALTTAGIQGPYVLVGHSFGGINMRLFARRFPAEVDGLVLVDSAHERQSLRFPYLKSETDALLAQFRTLSWISAPGLMALTPGSIPNRGLPAEAYAQYQAVLASSGYFSGAIAESSIFYSGTAAPETGTLGDLPLIVLSHGRPDMSASMTDDRRSEFESEWSKVQAELAALSSRSKHIVASESGHNIHLEQPELVIGSILELVMASR